MPLDKKNKSLRLQRRQACMKTTVPSRDPLFPSLQPSPQQVKTREGFPGQGTSRLHILLEQPFSAGGGPAPTFLFFFAHKIVTQIDYINLTYFDTIHYKAQTQSRTRLWVASHQLRNCSRAAVLYWWSLRPTLTFHIMKL